MTAAGRFSRIVSLVADLTRHEREGSDAPTIRELAGRHGVSERDINADIRALTAIGERADADWLLSLKIWQQGDQVSISSRGPFRRPVRLSPEEQLAIQVGLALDPDGSALAARFAALWSGTSPGAPAADGAPGEEPVVALVRRAIRDRYVLALEYAGEGERDVRARTVHPRQLAEAGIRKYVVAWAEDVRAWRHFRLDRIMSARLTGATFEPRADFEPVTQPRDVFRPHTPTEKVTVRFRPDAAHWATESFADHEAMEDGSVLVHFEASSVEWLTRRVLEFGPEAEVVEPARYREAVQRAIA